MLRRLWEGVRRESALRWIVREGRACQGAWLAVTWRGGGRAVYSRRWGPHSKQTHPS
jgi:hypothetical protein